MSANSFPVAELKKDLLLMFVGQVVVLVSIIAAVSLGFLPNARGYTFIALVCANIPFYKKYFRTADWDSPGALLRSQFFWVSGIAALSPLALLTLLSVFAEIPE